MLHDRRNLLPLRAIFLFEEETPAVGVINDLFAASKALKKGLSLRVGRDNAVVLVRGDDEIATISRLRTT